MKPSFALDFRDGAIALLHRTSRGWQLVGSTSIEAPDLTEALAYMRSTALGLSPRGLSTKLILPSDQVLLTSVHAPGPDAARRRKQIKAALEGLTPYSVDDLAFDWSGSGSEVRVAIVARETLAEAEAFATEHRFNPVSFVAAPDDASFQGEPHFGVTALSETLLAAGEKVERDQDAVIVVTRDLPRAEAAAPQPAARTEVEVAPAVAPAPEPPVVADDPAPQTVAPVEAEVSAQAETPPQAEEVPPAEAPAPAPISAEAGAAPAQESPPAGTDATPDRPDPAAAEELALPDFASAKAPADGPGSFDLKAIAVDLVEEAPMALDVASEGKDSLTLAQEAAPERPAKDDTPASPAPSILAAFSSRRPVEAAPPEAGDAVPADFAKAAAEARARKAPSVGPAPAQRPSVSRPNLAKPASSTGVLRDALPFPGRSTAKPTAAKAKPALAGAIIQKPNKNVVPMPKATAAPSAEAKAGATPLGDAGLFGKTAPVGGKPRYLGLILTGLLLLALAVVAAWSSFSLSRNDVDPGLQPSDTGIAAAEPATGDLPSIEDEAVADGQDLPEEVAQEAAEDPASAPGTDDLAATEPVTEPAPEIGLTGENLGTAAPGSAPQDEIFLAANDLSPTLSDPVILPTLAAATDPPPQLGAPPPPFGTVYTFDANGRIQPTPEGIITPEGVLLVAGAPSQVPPSRPAAATAQAPATGEPVLAASPTTNSVLETYEADPALAGKRPRSRPEGLTPPPKAGQQGEATAPAPGQRFAAVRPEPRPAALTQPAGQAANLASAASLAATGLDPDSGAGLLASRKPLARPDGMDQAVDAAVAAALQSATSEPDAQAETASLAPEEEGEPELENPAPNIPTSASVASQATEKNVLNLSQVALIGIFGNAAGRYAMIRQPNGSIKRVTVGDRIDGGRVAAITATELQYQKGGRMVTLTLPRG